MPEKPTQSTAFIDRLRQTGVMAVIRAVSADAALEISRALVRGGVTGIEITFSTPGAAVAIERARKELPDALVGAGTVLDVRDLKAACDAGAEFLVSPHLDESLVVAA